MSGFLSRGYGGARTVHKRQKGLLISGTDKAKHNELLHPLHDHNLFLAKMRDES